MCPPEPDKLTLTWSGEQWIIEPPTPRNFIRPGFSIDVVVPVAASDSEGEQASELLMFARGTYLYLPLSPDRDEALVRGISQEHKRKHRPALSRWPTDKELVPIFLEQDLLLQNNRLAPCVCQIDGAPEKFESVNAAASHVLRLWRNTMTHAINVFDGVYFIHDRRLLSLAHQRNLVRDGIALPANPDRQAEGVADLFEKL